MAVLTHNLITEVLKSSGKSLLRYLWWFQIVKNLGPHSLCKHFSVVRVNWTFCVSLSPASKQNKHLHNICTMLDQRRRRWADVVQMLYKCFVFAGNRQFLMKRGALGHRRLTVGPRPSAATVAQLSTDSSPTVNWRWPNRGIFATFVYWGKQRQLATYKVSSYLERALAAPILLVWISAPHALALSPLMCVPRTWRSLIMTGGRPALTWVPSWGPRVANAEETLAFIGFPYWVSITSGVHARRPLSWRPYRAVKIPSSPPYP